MKRVYSLKPSPIDVRDRAFASLGLALKPHVDFESQLPPVWDQLPRSSCTSFAFGAAAAQLFPGFDPSQAFIWWNERNLEGTTNADTGCNARDGARVLHKLGVCSAALLPYDVHHYKVKPADECYAQALQHRVGAYHALHSLDDMLQCLNSGYGFAFGFQVFESFESEEVEKTGVLNMPQHGEKSEGYHEVFAMGYDLAARRVKVRNSYGPKWGQRGHFTVPFEFMAHRQLVENAWTVRK